MFYFGLVIAFLAFVLGLGIVRRRLQRWMPALTDGRLDVLRLVIFVSGIALAIHSHQADEEDAKEREALRRYAMRNWRGSILLDELGRGVSHGGELEYKLGAVMTTHPPPSQSVVNCLPNGTRARKELMESDPLLPHVWFAEMKCAEGDAEKVAAAARRCVDLIDKILALQPHSRDYGGMRQLCAAEMTE